MVRSIASDRETPRGAPASRRDRSRSRSRSEVKRILRDAFEREFPDGMIDVADGDAGNVHVRIISRRFDRMHDKNKQDKLWRIVDRTDLTEKEKQRISLLYPISPGQI
jgi:hypothetical protein